MPSLRSIRWMAGLALGLLLPRGATSLHQAASNLGRAASHSELPHHLPGHAKILVASTDGVFDFDSDDDSDSDGDPDDFEEPGPTSTNKPSQAKHKRKLHRWHTAKSAMIRLEDGHKVKPSGEAARKPWHIVDEVDEWEEPRHHAETPPSHMPRGSAPTGHTPRTPEPDAANLLYDHMPKAGGTFLIKLFNAAIGRENFETRTEFENVTQDDVDNNFVVGSVRNPCDYYLSLWAYGVERGGAMKHLIMPEHLRDYVYHTRSAHKNSTEDIRRFRRWIRLISSKGHPGVMSIRFAKSYAVLEQDIPGFLPPQALNKEELDSVARALATPDYKDRVSCWVKAERLDRDAVQCLHKWHHVTGRDINWRAFNEALSNANHLSSSHGRCKEYYTSKLAQAVRDLEAPIFRDFGYRGCCA